MSDKLPCDPANCPTGKDVKAALTIMNEFSLDIKGVRDAYEKTHDTLIEQTTTLKHVVETMETDRQERRETETRVFEKVEAMAVSIAGKADNDKVITKSGATITISLIVLVFVALGYIVSVL